MKRTEDEKRKAMEDKRRMEEEGLKAEADEKQRTEDEAKAKLDYEAKQAFVEIKKNLWLLKGKQEETSIS